jgi:hypothetical protein
MLVATLVNPDEKNVHTTNAEKENIGYGIPSDGILAKLPNIIVNTTIVMKGCRTAHDAPKTVCL